MKTAEEFADELFYADPDRADVVKMVEAREAEIRATAVSSHATELEQLLAMLRRVGFPPFRELAGAKGRAVEIDLPWAEHNVGFSFRPDGSLAKDATIYFTSRRRR